MKILYDCFSCSPYYGSDEGIGWLWPYYMRQYAEVWVLVRNDRRPDIEKYCEEHSITDIHFVYCDIPNWMNFYYKNLEKGKNGALDFLLYQLLWQFPAYAAAKKLHKKVKFDLVHHVSTNDFRLIGKMHRLHIPYLIGPIGGAQETPRALADYVAANTKTEKLRAILNKILTALPGYRKGLNSAKRIFFSNYETAEYLRPKINDFSKCSLLTEIAYKESEVSEKRRANDKDVCTFLWAGRMEYRKGLELLFDALDSLPMEKKWEVKLCGTGRELENYKALVQKKAYKRRVHFLGKIPYEELQNLYEEADVFVFPSLRETTGTVIIEAMAHGLPVICLKQGGGALVVDEKSGFLISGKNREEYIAGFSDAMQECLKDREKMKRKGEESREKILSEYTWERKTQYMLEIYQEVL